MQIHQLNSDVTVLNDHLPVPTIGFLPINAFVLHAAEPVVVDTGVSLPERGFMDLLGSVIDPMLRRRGQRVRAVRPMGSGP